MAETLGSLIDKLAIKNLREYHLKEMLKETNKKFSCAELRKKLSVLETQKKKLIQEVEGFIASAINGKVLLTDEKLKLYNHPALIGRIPAVKNLGEAISWLTDKNTELWHLEDQARRDDVPLSYIGKVKKKIDLANQQRNDFIDKIDEIFEKMLRKNKQ